MNNEIKLSKKEIIGICEFLKIHHFENAYTLLDYITNLQQENKIKDTNWESLKYYLEKLYYKDYIEEAISDDIDKKIKELESKVEIKGYQKDIKALQQENERLKEENKHIFANVNDDELLISNAMNYAEAQDYKSRCEKAIDFVKSMEYCGQEDYFYDMKASDICGNDNTFEDSKNKLLNILQNGSENDE